MTRNRDYQAEYAQRIANATRRGLSRSQARGHARHGESPSRTRPVVAHDVRMEAALKELRRSRNQKQAAKSAGVSTERFRRFLQENVLIKGRGLSLEIKDNRLRYDSVITTKGIKNLTFAGFEQASLIRRHKISSLLATKINDPDLMNNFRNVIVTDHKNRPFVLETDLNALHKTRASDEGVFHEIYRHTQ